MESKMKSNLEINSTFRETNDIDIQTVWWVTEIGKWALRGTKKKLSKGNHQWQERNYFSSDLYMKNKLLIWHLTNLK